LAAPVTITDFPEIDAAIGPPMILKLTGIHKVVGPLKLVVNAWVNSRQKS